MKYELYGKEYEIIGYAKHPKDKFSVPIIDIPMMSDEDWNKSAIKQAVKHYIERHGYEPESENIALEEERKIVEEFLNEINSN